MTHHNRISEATQEERIAFAVCSTCFLAPERKKCNTCKYKGALTMNGYTKEISEEDRLRNEINACSDQLHLNYTFSSDPGVAYWNNRLVSAQKELDKFMCFCDEVLDDDLPCDYCKSQEECTCSDLYLSGQGGIPCRPCEEDELKQDAAWFDDMADFRACEKTNTSL